MAVGRPIRLTPNVARKIVTATATASQTSFTPTGGYRIGELAVFRNGVRLVSGRDYTAVDGTTVSLQSACTLGDVVEFQIFDSFNIADAISANGNQSMGGDLTVGLTTMYSGATGIVSTTQFFGDGSNLTGVANTDYIDAASITSAGIVSVTNTTDSTSTTTGALIVSGGVGIAKSLFVGNNVTIGGTVTYEDVTNVDSVGIITARLGILVNGGRGIDIAGGGLEVTGVGTFKGILNADAEVTAAGGVDITGGLKVGAAITASSTLTVAGNVDIADTIYHTGDSNTKIRFPSNDTITAATSGSERVRVDSSGDVGINTDSPRGKLDVRGSVTLGGGQLAEKFATSGTALNSATSIDLDDGMVHYRSANLGAANVKPDIISSVGINTALKIGEAVAVTIITAVNNTSNYVGSVAIDGRTTGITTNWVGGSAPTEGGGSNIDIYAFNVLKTADNTFLVVANQTKCSS